VVTALPDSVIAKPLVKPDAATAASSKTKAPAARKRANGQAASPSLPGAVKAKLPDTLSPQLAALATGVPSAGTWLYELKPARAH
jgi:bifunctional non-homologous end joining protein LigD